MDVEELMRRVQASEASRKLHKAVWLQNVAFFKGAQYHRWSDLSGRFIYTPPDPEWRIRRVVNYFRAIALVMAAKLTQNRPSWTVVPATQEEDDKHKARLGQALLDWLWEKHDCQPKLFEAVLWSVICGNGFWQIYWDRDKGPDWEEAPLDGGAPVPRGPTGDLLIENVVPFDIGLDPLADSLDACEWGYRKRWASCAWVKQVFGKKAVADSPGAAGGPDEANHRKSWAALLTSPDTAPEFAENYLNVYEYYDVVKGRLYYFTKTRMLAALPWEDRLPFIHFRALPSLGDLEGSEVGSSAVLGETIMTDIVPMQQRLNRLDGQIEEIQNNIIYPRLLCAIAAQVNQLENIGVPGGLVHWSGMGPMPQPLHMGTVPNWAFQIRTDIIQTMFDVSGIHEISQGTSPGSIQSGRGLAILAEMDATKFGPWARAISEAAKQAGRRCLALYHDNAKAPVLLDAIGESGAMEVHTFLAETLTATDVRVQEGSTFSLSKSLRNDQAMQLFRDGLVQDRRKILRVIEFGQLEELAGAWDQDALRAKRENERLREGKPVRMEEFDDPQTHVEVHDTYMKSVGFELDPEAIQESFRRHRAEHMVRLQPQVAADQQAATQRGIASAGRPEGMMPAMGMGPGQGQLPMQRGVNPREEVMPLTMGPRLNVGG